VRKLQILLSLQTSSTTVNILVVSLMRKPCCVKVNTVMGKMYSRCTD